MKLKDSLFEITEEKISPEGFTTTITLNPEHIIYTGHFPGFPLTPGVVQMQIVHELLECHIGKKLRLVTMRDCKFIRILVPEKQQPIIISVVFQQKDEMLAVNATGSDDIHIYFKLKGNYRLFNSI